MAAKIKLGSRPASFSRAVSFPLPEGGEGNIQCLFKYRTKLQFGEFVDNFVERGRQKVAATQTVDSEPSNHGFQASLIEANAEYLLEILDGWDLEEDLSLATLKQLADEVPGAVGAIIDAYRAASLEGRLGN